MTLQFRVSLATVLAGLLFISTHADTQAAPAAAPPAGIDAMAFGGTTTTCNGAADDYPVISAAVAVANAAGGGRVYLPAGTCHISKGLSLSAGTIVTGHQGGVYATTLEPAGPMTSMITLTHSYAGVENIMLENN